MRNLTKFNFIIIGLFWALNTHGQVLSDSIGCIPLHVKFTSPNQTITNADLYLFFLFPPNIALPLRSSNTGVGRGADSMT
jgi:hypothetical protein